MDTDVLRQLYATPPPEFVAARNDLVKSWRKEQRRDDATALAALRRPGWDDWALNAVAGSDADVVAGFAAAAAAVREAQSAAIEGRDGPDIRTALRDLRDRSAELVRLAETALGGVGRQSGPGEINSRLSQLATNDVAVAQLLAGILGSGDTAPQDLFGGLEPAASPTKPAPRAGKQPKRKKAQEATEEAAPPDESAAVAARAEQQRRKDDLAVANRDHRATVADRKRAAAAVDKAEGVVEQARRALADAEAEMAGARETLEAATTAEEQADAAVDAARAALDA